MSVTWRTARRAVLPIAATGLLAGSLAACGSDSESSSGSALTEATTASSGGVCVAVGSATCIKVTKPIKLAVFSFGSANTYGRSIYATGGNAEAARLVGMRVAVVRGSTFVLSGMLAALAGCIAASKVSVGDATAGSTIALSAIAVIVVGGSSIAGGEGAVWRTAIGLLILATLTNVFGALSWDPSSQQVATGVLIVLAVAADLASRSGFRALRRRRLLGARGAGAA